MSGDAAPDPGVSGLMKVIKGLEGGDYNNRSGDAGSSAGAYQWNNDNKALKPGELPSHWKNAAAQYLKDQNAPMTQGNQDYVAYQQIKAYKDQGKTPTEIDALWNGAHKDASGQYVHNSDTRAAAFLKASNAQQPQGYNPKPFSNPTGGSPGLIDESGTATPASNPHPGFIQGLQEDLSGTNPESIPSQLGNTVKGVGNFLFPIVGDLYNDATGKNNKSFLQQAGDTALSALPFIPGLGEAGEAARVADAGVEGASAVAKSGLLARAAALPTVVKGAGVGYGAGVASNLSQGKSVGDSIGPNASTLGGALLGGAAPAVLKGIGGIAEKVSGIDPQIKTKLTEMGLEADPENVQLYNKYINAAKQHATNGEVPAPENIAADNVDTASAKIDQAARNAGAEVGQANKAAASMPVSPDKVTGLASALNEGLDNFGLKVGTKPDGTLTLVPTRAGGVALTAAEQARVLDVANRINELGNDGNVRMADDLMTTLDKKHDYGMTGQDPLSALFGQVRHAVNGVAQEASPAFGKANSKLSELKTLQETIRSIAGNKLQRGELLMQRMFGKNPGDAQLLFKKIKDATGVDLYKHAVLARHAIQSVGSSADQSALQQMIEGSVRGHSGIIGAVANIAKGAARKTFANPEKIGRNIIKGGKGSIVPSLITKGAIRTGAAL